jgi:hypothetical protein
MRSPYTRKQLEKYLQSKYRVITPQALSFLESITVFSQERCIKVWHDWINLEQCADFNQKHNFSSKLSGFENDFLWIACHPEEKTQSLISVDDEQGLSLAEVEQQLGESGL